MSPRLLLAAAVAAVAALATAGCGGRHGEVADIPATQPAAFDYDDVIPAGTAERVADGAEVDILPEKLWVYVGETLRIRNDDDVAHTIGVFFVGAHETLAQRFSSPGELQGECSIRPEGVSITVLS